MSSHTNHKANNKAEFFAQIEQGLTQVATNETIPWFASIQELQKLSRVIKKNDEFCTYATFGKVRLFDDVIYDLYFPFETLKKETEFNHLGISLEPDEGRALVDKLTHLLGSADISDDENGFLRHWRYDLIDIKVFSRFTNSNERAGLLVITNQKQYPEQLKQNSEANDSLISNSPFHPSETTMPVSVEKQKKAKSTTQKSIPSKKTKKNHSQKKRKKRKKKQGASQSIATPSLLFMFFFLTGVLAFVSYIGFSEAYQTEWLQAELTEKGVQTSATITNQFSMNVTYTRTTSTYNHDQKRYNNSSSTSKEPVYYLDVSYKDRQGNPYQVSFKQQLDKEGKTKEGLADLNQFDKGDEVTIKYLPSDPQRALVIDQQGNYVEINKASFFEKIGSYVLILATLILLLFSLYLTKQYLSELKPSRK